MPLLTAGVAAATGTLVRPSVPLWLVAVSYRVLGESAFSTHLPNTLAMVGLVGLAWVWACISAR